jgi:hypothetical protein
VVSVKALSSAKAHLLLKSCHLILHLLLLHHLWVQTAARSSYAGTAAHGAHAHFIAAPPASKASINITGQNAGDLCTGMPVQRAELSSLTSDSAIGTSPKLLASERHTRSRC